MSIIGVAIPEARVLDLYAGTGALGLELLSRGAAHATFVESDAKVRRVLEANITALDARERCTIERGDALAFVRRTATAARLYDIVCADPPYASAGAVTIATTWLDAPFASILGVEHDPRTTLPPGGDTRRYGDTAITFYRE